VAGDRLPGCLPTLTGMACPISELVIDAADPGPPAGKLRLHIDANATDRDQDAELERLLALGARPADVGQGGTESWHVLADPEGNEFCLLHTRLQPLWPEASGGLSGAVLTTASGEHSS
jgi:hypothetical protein